MCLCLKCWPYHNGCLFEIIYLDLKAVLNLNSAVYITLQQWGPQLLWIIIVLCISGSCVCVCACVYFSVCVCSLSWLESRPQGLSLSRSLALSDLAICLSEKRRVVEGGRVGTAQHRSTDSCFVKTTKMARPRARTSVPSLCVLVWLITDN